MFAGEFTRKQFLLLFQKYEVVCGTPPGCALNPLAWIRIARAADLVAACSSWQPWFLKTV